jgi:hypothetical protein
MTEWFECKVSYESEADDGKSVKIKQEYLVDAVNFIEAETRLTEEVSKFITGDFKVETVKREKVYDIFNSKDGDTWFKCKIELIVSNEKNEKEKRIKIIVYLLSTGFDNVIKELNDSMHDTMSDFSILSVAKTNIVDIFGYNN